ncbi:MAG: helix-turn-helix domain-containing protein [Pseudomonadota bacterium]
MHNFFKQAVVRFGCLLVASFSLGYVCVDRSFLSAALLPADQTDFPWLFKGNTDAIRGGKSTVQIEGDKASLRFTLQMSHAVDYPMAAAELVFQDQRRRPVHVDLSRYGAVAFKVRCAPANTLMFIVTTFDKAVSRRDDLLTYRAPLAYFSCDEHEKTIELDLTRLETPHWWFDMFKLNLARQEYKLDQVPKLAFNSTSQTPFDVPAKVVITDLVLTGRDYRYLFLLAFLLITGWGIFAIWFFRAYARALTAEVKEKLRKDLPFVAYQQLSLTPHRDKEKSAVLVFINANYSSADLDLDVVVERTGVNRSKINELLKSELGFTFSAYLKKLRLTEAARLLSENTSATIAEIAYSVGYGNVSYFNKLFKEEYECTPKAFRIACEHRA